MRAGLRPGDDVSEQSEHPDIYELPPATIIAQFKRTGYFSTEEGQALPRYVQRVTTNFEASDEVLEQL